MNIVELFFDIIKNKEDDIKAEITWESDTGYVNRITLIYSDCYFNLLNDTHALGHKEDYGIREEKGKFFIRWETFIKEIKSKEDIVKREFEKGNINLGFHAKTPTAYQLSDKRVAFVIGDYLIVFRYSHITKGHSIGKHNLEYYEGAYTGVAYAPIKIKSLIDITTINNENYKKEIMKAELKRLGA